MSRTRALLLLPLLLALGGCITTSGPGSVTRGECKVFDAPRYAIRGATQHDQDWIDPTIESGVGGCRWARPSPRPVEWDAPKKPTEKRKAPVAAHVAAPAADPKKGWLWRALPTLARKPSKPPVAMVAPPEPSPAPVPAAVIPAPPPPAPPRSAIDILLHPSVN